MNEPLTIAKVRKETKITVPAGGWILLVGPDEHFSEHAAARSKIVNFGLVNDDYETVCIGRLRNTHSNIRLATKAERKAADEEMEKSMAAFEKSSEEAKKRAAAIDASELDKEKAAHAEIVAKVSKENDAVRNRSLK